MTDPTWGIFLYFFIIIALFGAHYLQRVIGALGADILPAHVHPTDDGLNLAFAARGKLDCPDAIHKRLRLTPHFEPSQSPVRAADALLITAILED
jgi:hypothetical protein